MTLKSYLLGIRLSTVASLIAWLLVIGYIDPEKSGVAGQIFFYVSALLFFSGLFISFFVWLKGKTSHEEEAVFSQMGVSFRQGILMAILMVILLIFQQYRVLTWWDAALSVAGVFLIELYFLTKK